MRRMRKPLLALVLLISLAMATNLLADEFVDELAAGGVGLHNYTCTASDGRDPATSIVDSRNLTGSIGASVLITHNGIADCEIYLTTATYCYRNWGNLQWDTQFSTNNIIQHHLDAGSNGTCFFKTAMYPY